MVDHLPNIQIGLDEVTDEVKERVKGADGRWRRKTVSFRFRGKKVLVPDEATLREAILELKRQDLILKLLILASRSFEERSEIDDAALWYDYSLDQAFALQDTILEIAGTLEERLKGELLTEPSLFPSLDDAHERTLMALNNTLETTRLLTTWVPGAASEEIEKYKLCLARGRGLIDFFLREAFSDLVAADPREGQLVRDASFDARLERQKKEGWALLDALDRLRRMCREFQPHAKQLQALADAVQTFIHDAATSLAGSLLASIAAHLDPLEPILDHTREILSLPAVRLEEIAKLSERLADLRQSCSALHVWCEHGRKLAETSQEATRSSKSSTADEAPSGEDPTPIVELLLAIEHAFQDLMAAADAWFASVSHRKYLYETGRSASRT